MTITTRDKLISALGNSSARLLVDKASVLSQTAGRFISMWTSAGQPPVGTNPTVPALCNSALTGAMSFVNPTAPAASYLGWLALACSNATATVEIHDRLVHNGGLDLTLLTAQLTTGLDLVSLAPSAERIGAADYSDVQWWLEVYVDGGATASNATINVTYDDASTGDLTVLAVGGTIRKGNMFGLTQLIPAAKQGRSIRGINQVTLSASTGTAGNFGFTATRGRTTAPLVVANKSEVFSWAALGMPKIPDDACLTLMMLPTTTSSGTLRGAGKLAQG
jgi:hypothetical protein